MVGAFLAAGILITEVSAKKNPGQAVLDRLNLSVPPSLGKPVLSDARLAQGTSDRMVVDANTSGVPISLPYGHVSVRVPSDALGINVTPYLQEEIHGDGLQDALLVKIRHRSWSFTCVDGPGSGKDTVGNALKIAVANIARGRDGEKLRAPILAGLEDSGLSEQEARELMRIQWLSFLAESSEELLERFVKASPDKLRNAEDPMQAAELGILLLARSRIGHLVRLDRIVVGERTLVLANTVEKLKSADGYRVYLFDSEGSLQARGWFRLLKERTCSLKRDAALISWLLRLDCDKAGHLRPPSAVGAAE